MLDVKAVAIHGVSRNLDVIYVAGPGHGGPALVANVCRQGTYSEVYPNVERDIEGSHLVGDVFDGVPGPGALAAYARQEMRDKLIEHREHITRSGDDMAGIREWKWSTV